jgi:replicative DNA helicase
VDKNPGKTNLADLLKERVEERNLEKLASTTGFPNLDRLIKGFIPGHTYLLSGQTNVGKTALAVNFAVNTINQGKKVLYLALEPQNKVFDYIASIITGKCFDDLTDEDILDLDLGDFLHVEKNIKTLEAMVAMIEMSEVDFVIIDHLGYFIPDNSININETKRTITQRLAQIANQKRMPILFIEHIRKGTNDKPRLEDVTGSKGVVDNSTEVLMLIKDRVECDKYQIEYENTGAILVLKTKSGKNGACEVLFVEVDGHKMTGLVKPLIANYKLESARLSNMSAPLRDEVDEMASILGGTVKEMTEDEMEAYRWR